ncbi:transcriptional regulator, AraC family [Pseudopedobacter saltans DSM 12145]|uniref:Transcriptional regulator, AraC family n=1 Tax=Pseudopedobacter saltans (strain ATCC 51119 / DSM 12145 / JCM 21818 / CCUG 39354 / LMG 10337 / NBRC 100064 / NCIMB 13643) TaxID=762903 RepID=F0SAK3_PSESL|nr:helix-turn-helix domain-containing protein [Pseudopedobacter saltans]ADY52623.1 transcriptional regulator, AraC family [Pseudopedobacter saltans DSM 12145]
MKERVTEQTKRDPSQIIQVFNDVNIKLLCCRYWVLDEWECNDFSAPFWRIYHNTIGGAKIYFENMVIEPQKGSLIIIPPHTKFITRLKNSNSNEESISGRKIRNNETLETIASENRIDHLFIHFSLGFPLDFAKKNINVISCTDYIYELIQKIQKSCKNDTVFSFSECLQIKQLINEVILNIKSDTWRYETIDQRVFTAMRMIEKNFQSKISNEELAEKASMAVNSFSRLFKVSTGISIQQYLIKVKIENACSIMHHTDKTIDEIAYDCGFFDRHHFSKTFKKVMNITPVYYKKRLTMNQ